MTEREVLRPSFYEKHWIPVWTRIDEISRRLDAAEVNDKGACLTTGEVAEILQFIGHHHPYGRCKSNVERVYECRADCISVPA